MDYQELLRKKELYSQCRASIPEVTYEAVNRRKAFRYVMERYIELSGKESNYD